MNFLLSPTSFNQYLLKILCVLIPYLIQFLYTSILIGQILIIYLNCIVKILHSYQNIFNFSYFPNMLFQNVIFPFLFINFIIFLHFANAKFPFLIYNLLFCLFLPITRLIKFNNLFVYLSRVYFLLSWLSYQIREMKLSLLNVLLKGL